MVDFVFVNQPMFNGIPVPREPDCSSPQLDDFMQPLGLMYLAGVARDLFGKEAVRLIDANVLQKDYDWVAKEIKKEDPKIVIGNITAPTLYHDTKLADVVKENSSAYYGTWGPIPSAIHDKMFKDFPNLDFIIDNEPEDTLKELLQNFESGKKNPFAGVKGLTYRTGKTYKFNGYRPLAPNLDHLPIPFYEGVPMKLYRTPFNRRRPMTIMRTSRGCPASCTFCITGGQCDIYRGYGKPWRAYSAERALKEIELVVKEFGVREINFFDPEFTIDKKRVQDIAKGIIERNLDVVWNCTARVDYVDFETLKWMKKSGCYGVAYGVESADEGILKRVKKNITLSQVESAIILTKAAGIKPSTFFMVGLPGETKETMKKTFDFAYYLMRKYHIRPQCTIATPYPGTCFFKEAVENKWIKTDISNFDQTLASIEYPTVSKEDLQEFHDMFYKKIAMNPIRLFWRVLEIRNPEEIYNAFIHLKERLISRGKHVR